jgi:FAD/FMN-containing dehydrogenase
VDTRLTEVAKVTGGARWERLRTRFAGSLVRHGDEGYDAARRVWNGSIDRYPALVARCAGAADVAAALEFGRESGLTLAVRGGGHNVAGFGTCDGGVVIDLSGMQAVRVDRTRRRALVQGGATWAGFDREAQIFGLATTGGLMSSTGVAGFTLGGGIGWLMRRYGLACDNLLSAEVVTADGRQLRASPLDHDGLFWGLRGGGGNLGIVTRFEFGLHPVGPEVLGGLRLYPHRLAPEVIATWRDLMLAAPDELTLATVLRRAPASPTIPEQLHGEPVVAVAGMYAGPVEDGARLLRALDGLGPPLVDGIGPKPYTAVQSMSDGAWQPGFENYWKAEFLHSLDDSVIETVVDFAGRISSPLSDIKLAPLGGAIGRVAEGDTAYPHRQAPWVININTRWAEGPPDEHVAWTRALWEQLQPASTGGVYVNFLGDEGPDRVRAAYGDSNYQRLARLKAVYDPDNVFHLNQNIPPAP